jgi:spermidine/putrescine transport system substrate-binding protein
MTQKKLYTGKTFNRRTFVQGAAATSAFVAAGPAYITNAFSSSGEVDILMWSDYLPP